MTASAPDIQTLSQLRASGYQSRSVKEEVRQNLIRSISGKEHPFQTVIGYEDTVVPDVERALLSRHNILFLGLRGQAKTRMAREMTHLLDEWMPAIDGSEINDDPLHPISSWGRKIVAEKGDDTPIRWVHRSERYSEKLATPDVSVADLIGDIDPIKAANLRVALSDDQALHYGIIPRSHRGIFVINELPDLQARIQVALFNILQEGDIQIRGFKLRMPLDILFVFTANPEDYTNRGSIVTPLKDRIESQIITHYPKTVAISQAITAQEADILPEQENRVEMPDVLKVLVEELAMQARKSEFVDQKSGVSARLTISAYENLVSAAERRALRQGVAQTMARVADFAGVVSSITGKIELVYEGEVEGPAVIAQRLLGLAIREVFTQYFPDPATFKKAERVGKGSRQSNPYKPIIEWFEKGNELTMGADDSDTAYREKLFSVGGLYAAVKSFYPQADDTQTALLAEFMLHALAEFSLITRRQAAANTFAFGDLLSGILNMDFDESEE